MWLTGGSDYYACDCVCDDANDDRDEEDTHKKGDGVWGRKVDPGWAAAPTFPSAEHKSQGRAEQHNQGRSPPS